MANVITTDLRQKLEHAVTEYDRVMEALTHEGVTLQMALAENFEDRLLTVVYNASK